MTLNPSLTPKKFIYFIGSVVLPIVVGSLFYYTTIKHLLPDLITNYLSDGVWAFAFSSALLLIWDGAINKFWRLTLLLTFPAFELLQMIHIINGSGDLYDILCYYLFSLLAFFIYSQTF